MFMPMEVSFCVKDIFEFWLVIDMRKFKFSIKDNLNKCQSYIKLKQALLYDVFKRKYVLKEEQNKIWNGKQKGS